MIQERPDTPVSTTSQRGAPQPHEGSWWREGKEALQSQNTRRPQKHLPPRAQAAAS